MMNEKTCAISHAEETQKMVLKAILKKQIDDTKSLDLLKIINTVMNNYGKKTWEGAE